MTAHKKNIEARNIIFGSISLCAIIIILIHMLIWKEGSAIKEHYSDNGYMATTTPEGKPYQYVVFAFDGSRSLKKWQETLDFAKAMREAGAAIHFTYFINAIYLVPEIHKNIYHPPNNPVGTSLVGYGLNPEEIGERIGFINRAYHDGHEIGSHGVGHIPGNSWTKSDWLSEFTQFNAILERARQGIDTTTKLEVPQSAIRGFRAPDLVVDSGLDQAIDEFGYSYDTSWTTSLGKWPIQRRNHWEMSLASIPHKGWSDILAMDYNFYYSDSEAKDILKKNDPIWKQKHDEMLLAYINYFTINYNSSRAPVFIGHHFSDWNDGLYWSVLQEAARSICSKPYVRCATYEETRQYLDTMKFTPLFKNLQLY